LIDLTNPRYVTPLNFCTPSLSRESRKNSVWQNVNITTVILPNGLLNQSINHIFYSGLKQQSAATGTTGNR